MEQIDDSELELQQLKEKMDEQIVITPELRKEMMAGIEQDIREFLQPGYNSLVFFSDQFDPKSYCIYDPKRKELWMEVTLIGQKPGEEGWTDEVPSDWRSNPSKYRYTRKTQVIEHLDRKVHIVEHDWDETYGGLLQFLQGACSEIGVESIIIPEPREEELRIAQKLGFKKVVKSVNMPCGKQTCYVWEPVKHSKHGSVRLRNRKRRRK